MFNVTSRGQTFISADVNTPPNSPSKVHFIPLLSRLSKTKFLDLKWYIIGLSSFFSAREVIIVDRFAILVGFLISTTSNKPSCISFLNNRHFGNSDDYFSSRLHRDKCFASSKISISNTCFLQEQSVELNSVMPGMVSDKLYELIIRLDAKFYFGPWVIISSNIQMPLGKLLF